MRLLFLVLLCTCSGCTSLHKELVRAIPDGQWESVNVTITGKFSSTQATGQYVLKDGEKFSAAFLRVRHSNAWIPLIEIDLKGINTSK